MITRIKINGFKSLIDVDLRFSTFTCIAGANAVGKSNLFDALAFLSKLADSTLVEAAKSIRSEDKKHSNARDIFYRYGEKHIPEMSFEVELIVPKSGIDDLGQTANATITSLRYSLVLGLNSDEFGEPISIKKESLEPITQTTAKQSISFKSTKEWRDKVFEGRRGTQNPFISTDLESGKIKLHQDKAQGRTADFIGSKMARTLLSTVTAESPTAFLVRQEMRNWLMLQFEPSALREPNEISETRNSKIQANGANMPATLYRLNKENPQDDIYQRLTNNLSNLIQGVKELSIDKDEKRDLLTLQLGFKGGLKLPAQFLSDGTLRFLALSVIKEDDKSNGLMCLEEPENGIHPDKTTEMIELLTEIATDTNSEDDNSNTLRQVIVNTHSPLVVQKVNDESLLLAKHKEVYSEYFGKKVRCTGFECLKDTWRSELEGANVVSVGDILDYLGGGLHITKNKDAQKTIPQKKVRTVKENIENQLSLFDKS